MTRYIAVLLCALSGVITARVPCSGEDERIPSDTLWRFQGRYLHAGCPA